MNNLAVIIPAYKDAFLKEALQSLARQSDRNFNVYIGDDNSPCDLERIVSPFYSELQIRYTKFPNNIGAKLLVAQWERCIDLMQQEDWIWVFADDDIASNSCVKEFRNAVKATGGAYDIYTFNTTVIDRHGAVISIPPLLPASESAVEYAQNLLLNKRANCMSDHIFSAKVYRRNGGFVHTDYAQGADWLNSILLAQDKGICHVPNAMIFWRYSGSNISSMAYKRKSETIKGHLQFIEWTLEHFKYLKDTKSTGAYQQIADAALWNLEHILTNHYRGVDRRNIVPVLLLIKRRFEKSLFASIKILLAINTCAPRQRVKSLVRRLPYTLKTKVQQLRVGH